LTVVALEDFKMLDAKECREYAIDCMKQAAEAVDPIVRQRLSETAQAWAGSRPIRR
jgi:hypothetical protein